MKSQKLLYIITTFAFYLGLTSCDKRENNVLYPAGITDNIVTTAQKSGLNIFASAIRAAGMDTTFSYLGQYTILAPTDSALNAAGITSASVASMNKDALRAFLRNHIIPGRTSALSLLPGPNAPYNNINRDFIYTSSYVANSSIVQPAAILGTYFNGDKVLKTDILSNNGLFHIINGILAPVPGNLTATLTANPSLSLLQAALDRTGLTAALNGLTSSVTLLAPNNAAFIAAGFPDVAAINAANITTLTNILRLHVIPATSATTTAGRLFSCDFRTTTYPSLQTGSNITSTLTGIVPTFRGDGNGTNQSGVVTPDLLYRSAISTGQPNVLHIVNRVLLP